MDVIDTTDRDEAARALAQSFPGLEVREDPDRRPFRFRYSRAQEGIFTRTRMRVHGVVETPGIYPDHVAIGRRRRGHVEVRYGSDRLDTGQPYLRPPGSSTARFENSDVELLIVERRALEVHALRCLQGSGRVLVMPRPGRAAPISRPAARLWIAAVEALTTRTSAEGEAIRHALSQEVVIGALLSTFPLTEERARPGGDGVQPRIIRRATDFIDANLGQPLTVGAIAQAAGVPLRTLEAGFRRHLDTTPRRHLHRSRLAAAHQELSVSSPAETTVAAVARRWGFTHLSRFAAAYRAEYGENPSDTLRR